MTTFFSNLKAHTSNIDVPIKPLSTKRSAQLEHELFKIDFDGEFKLIKSAVMIYAINFKYTRNTEDAEGYLENIINQVYEASLKL